LVFIQFDNALHLMTTIYCLVLFVFQIVIANLLETRKKEIFVVTKETQRCVSMSEEELKNGMEIEILCNIQNYLHFNVCVIHFILKVLY
jgi:hypothetical protein